MTAKAVLALCRKDVYQAWQADMIGKRRQRNHNSDSGGERGSGGAAATVKPPNQRSIKIQQRQQRPKNVGIASETNAMARSAK